MSPGFSVTETDGKVDVIQAQLRITACADSLATLGPLVSDIVSGLTGPKPYGASASGTILTDS
jgi:hypothetical protein